MKISSSFLEPLEARIAPATLTVTTVADSGPGSLRQAILEANANGQVEPDIIAFDIAGSGAHLISLLSALPALTARITVDGSTQAGYTSAPLIFIDGAGAGAGVVGLTLGFQNEVKAMGVTHFSSHGIAITASEVKITRSYIGVDATGNGAAGNGGSGIYLIEGLAPTIGGTLPGEGNVISGNGRYGIEIPDTSVFLLSAPPMGKILGNYIGVNATGQSSLGNTLGGISAIGTDNYEIAKNLISGNAGPGIHIQWYDASANATTGLNIHDNIVGLNAEGTIAIPNIGAGIIVMRESFPAYGNPIVTPVLVTDNLVSGNTSSGIVFHVSKEGRVSKNVIGLGSDGVTVFANGDDGIEVLGQLIYVTQNTVAGNSGDGIRANGSSVSIQNNAVRSNSGDGVVVSGTSISVTSNVIGGNTGDGIEISDATFMGIGANKIGTDASGLQANGNGGVGIRVLSTSYPTQQSYPTGQVLSVSTNLIANNNGGGISMNGTLGSFTNNQFGFNAGGATVGTGAIATPVLNSAVIAVSPDGSPIGTRISGSFSTALNAFAPYRALTLYFYALNEQGIPATLIGAKSMTGAVQDFSVVIENTAAIGQPIVATAVFEETATRVSNLSGYSTFRADKTSLFSAATTVKNQINVGNAVLTEGQSGTNFLTFQVSLTAPNPTGVTVDFATGIGTATAGSDYIAQNGTLTFAPGEVLKTISVPVQSDLAVEANETLLLILSNATGLTIGRGQALGFILNDDSPTTPSLSIADATVTEATGAKMNFVITLNEPQATNVSVSFSTSDRTAVGRVIQYHPDDQFYDFFHQNGVVTFAPGETSKTVSIDVNPDSVGYYTYTNGSYVTVLGPPAYEGNETFALNLSNPVGATLVKSTAIGTIIESAPTPTVAISDVAVKEGNTGMKDFTFTLTRSAGGTMAQVNYSTAGDTAQAGTDFVMAGGIVEFAVGELTKTITIQVKGDSIMESDEQFFVLLSSPVNVQITDAVGVGTIRNDDGVPPPVISIAATSRTEGNSGSSGMNFTVSLNQVWDEDITVSYQTANGTAMAGEDFQAASGTLTIPAGQTVGTISILTNGDTTPEFNETFSVNLHSPTNATLGNASALGTLISDDGLPTPVVSISGASITEGHQGTKTLIFTVSLDHADQNQYFVSFTTADGTAVAGTDYEAQSGTLVFNAGQLSKTISITILGDTNEESSEVFTLTLAGPTNLTLETTQATGTILDDDGPVLPVLNIAHASTLEGNSGTKTLNFLLTLNQASSSNVSVFYQTSHGTASGDDYQSAATSIVIPAGQTSILIPITILGDVTPESDETFFVTLGSPTGATLGTSVATGTILDDDGPVLPVVNIAPASTLEGNSGTKTLNFLLTLSQASSSNVTVFYQTSHGTASGDDYQGAATSIVIPAGQTSILIPITILGDVVPESDETFFVTLGAPTGATLGTSVATGTITSDDPTSSDFKPSDFAINRNKTIATWTDTDGDKVSVRVNRGILAANQFTFVSTADGFGLGELDLFNAPKGMSVRVTATTANGGDGEVHIGQLRVSADRAVIDVDGSVENLQVGSNTGLGGHRIRVATLGGDHFGVLYQSDSQVRGSIAALTVTNDWDSAVLNAVKVNPRGQAGIGSVTIGGDMISEPDAPSWLQADGVLGRLTVGGSIQGESSLDPVTIVARSINGITVKGDVDHATIIAGLDGSNAPVTAPARISSVIVKGHWNASNLSAGATEGDDGEFGTGDDGQFGARGSLIGLLKVGSFVSSADTTDSFLITSKKVATVIAGNQRVSLSARSLDDVPTSVGSDVRILEFA